MLAQKAQLVLLQQPASSLAEATRSYQLPPRRHKAPAPSPRGYSGQGERPRVARAACKPMIKVFQNIANFLPAYYGPATTHLLCKYDSFVTDDSLVEMTRPPCPQIEHC